MKILTCLLKQNVGFCLPVLLVGVTNLYINDSDRTLQVKHFRCVLSPLGFLFTLELSFSPNLCIPLRVNTSLLCITKETLFFWQSFDFGYALHKGYGKSGALLHVYHDLARAFAVLYPTLHLVTPRPWHSELPHRNKELLIGSSWILKV